MEEMGKRSELTYACFMLYVGIYGQHPCYKTCTPFEIIFTTPKAAFVGSIMIDAEYAAVFRKS